MYTAASRGAQHQEKKRGVLQGGTLCMVVQYPVLFCTHTHVMVLFNTGQLSLGGQQASGPLQHSTDATARRNPLLPLRGNARVQCQ